MPFIYFATLLIECILFLIHLPYGTLPFFLIHADESTEKVNSDGVQIQETSEPTFGSQAVNKSQEEIESEKNPISKEIWIDYEDFCVCFQ